MTVLSSFLSYRVIGTDKGRSGGKPVLKSISEQSCLRTVSTTLSLPNLASALEIRETVIDSRKHYATGCFVAILGDVFFYQLKLKYFVVHLYNFF